MKMLLAILILSLGISESAYAQQWRANVYLGSYHPDKEAAVREGVDNQENPGLGINYTFANGVFIESGIYKDSGSNTAKYAGVGYYHPFFNERLLIGGAFALMHSDTYNEGNAFVAPIPSMALDFRSFRIHAVWFPKVSGFNEVESFGFYVSVPFGGKPSPQ